MNCCGTPLLEQSWGGVDICKNCQAVIVYSAFGEPMYLRKPWQNTTRVIEKDGASK